MKDAVLETLNNSVELARSVQAKMQAGTVDVEGGTLVVDDLRMKIARCRRVLNKRYGVLVPVPEGI